MTPEDYEENMSPKKFLSKKNINQAHKHEFTDPLPSPPRRRRPSRQTRFFSMEKTDAPKERNYEMIFRLERRAPSTGNLPQTQLIPVSRESREKRGLRYDISKEQVQS